MSGGPFFIGTIMALTDVELIYAAAADLIGEIEINDDSDQDVKPYSTCDRHYEQARDEMIRGYAWNEATELALCLEDSTVPSHTWTYRFSLPDDCLRPLHTSRPRLNWRILGGFAYGNYKITPGSYSVGTEYKVDQYLSYESITYKIHTAFTATVWATDNSAYLTTLNADYGYIELEYVKELEDPTTWSVDLRNAIILNLAAKIVIPITSDQERRTALLEELHSLVLPHSRAIDAMQGKPQQFFYSSIIDSRGYYGS